MALPIPSRSWQIDKNRIASTGGDEAESVQNAMIAIVAALLSLPDGGVVIRGCSNGSTVTTTNLWTSTLTMNWAEDPGDATSWIRLGFPGIGATFEVVLAFVSIGSDLDMAAWASWGGFTGGTTHAPPTASDAVQFLGTSGAGTPGFVVGGGSGPDRVVHTWLDRDGKAWRVFVFRGGALDMAFQVDAPGNGVSGWNEKFVARWVPGVVGGVNQMSYAALNVVDAGFVGQVDKAGLHPLAFGLTGEGVGGQLVPQRLTGGGQISGIYPVTPMGLFSASSYFADMTISLADRYGKMVDMWWGAHDAPTGSTYPDDGTRQLIQIGDTVHPWDGAALFRTASP